MFTILFYFSYDYRYDPMLRTGNSIEFLPNMFYDLNEKITEILQWTAKRIVL